MTRVKIGRYRPAGTRNYIATGDMARVDPEVGRSFLGRVRRITAPADVDPDSVVDLEAIELDVTIRKQVSPPYRPHSHRGRVRCITAAAVTRVDQTLHPADEDPPSV